MSGVCEESIRRPEAVLACCYSNSRLVSADAETVSFSWKDYPLRNGRHYKVMNLATGQCIQRFVLHVLPQRIWHCGFIPMSDETEFSTRPSVISCY